MASREQTRSSRWPWLVPLVVVGLMAAASTLSTTGHRATLRELIDRVEARGRVPLAREQALYGDVEDGVAFDAYLRVRRWFDEPGKAFVTFVPEAAEWATIGGRDDVRELRSRWQPMLADLRDGAHRRVLTFEHGFPLDEDWSRLILVECDALMHEGAADRAVHTWLDAMTLALDAARVPAAAMTVSPPMSMATRLAEFWSDRRLRSLPSSARAVLRRGASIAERQLARREDLELWLAGIARHVLSDSYQTAAFGVTSCLRAWRSGFSPRWAAIRGVASAATRLADLEPPARSWNDRLEQFEKFRAGFASGSAMGDSPATIFQMAESQRRCARLATRLLAMALRVMDGEPAGEFPDPFGDGALQVVDEGDVVEIRGALPFGVCENVRIVTR